MARGICSVVLIALTFFNLGAVLLYLTGTYGWLGQERDPLSGVFLLPLVNLALLAATGRFVQRTD